MRIFAIVQKVLKELFRDKRTLALMFVAPIFIMWLMNIMFSANTTIDVNLATVNVPQQIVTKMEENSHLTIEIYQSRDQADSALKDNKVDSVITYDSKDGYSVVYANTDSTKTAVTRQSIKSAIVATQINQLVEAIQKLTPQAANSQTHSAAPFISETYVYGNEDTGFFAKMIPILLGFIIFFFVFLISGMALLKERTTGTLNRLLATPVKRSEIVFGYMISYGLLAIIQSIVIVCSAIWLLNVEVVGNIFNVIIVSVILGVVALTFGILLSTLAKSEFQMMQFIPLVVMPQLFFSGIIPLDSMASWARYVGKVLPLSYSGDAMNKIIIEGKGLSDISGDIFVLLGFLVVLTIANIFGMKRYRKV